jgi:hypothetical protein
MEGSPVSFLSPHKLSQTPKKLSLPYLSQTLLVKHTVPLPFSISPRIRKISTKRTATHGFTGVVVRLVRLVLLETPHRNQKSEIRN